MLLSNQQITGLHSLSEGLSDVNPELATCRVHISSELNQKDTPLQLSTLPSFHLSPQETISQLPLFRQAVFRVKIPRGLRSWEIGPQGE